MFSVSWEGPAHRYLVASATICRIDITLGCKCLESGLRQQGIRLELTRWEIVGYNCIVELKYHRIDSYRAVIVEENLCLMNHSTPNEGERK